MNGVELILGTAGMLGLAGSLIGVFVSHEKKMALSNQAIDQNQKQIDKLETRVTDLENNLFKKLDNISKDIQEIKINIVRNESKH